MANSQPINNSVTWDSLREEGLKHLQALSGHIWTDFDVHDPGVTILETLCYAITDLNSRLSRNIADLLADSGALADGRQFFSPREILTINPVTLNDYRKLLIDIPGVRNAWLFPAIDADPTLYYDKDNNALLYDYAPDSERITLNGLYRVYIEKDNDYMEKDPVTNEPQPLDDSELQRRVEVKLHAHRNLGEDFVEVNIMEQETISVFTDIQISDDIENFNEVAAQLYYDLKYFISPRVKQYSLKRMFQKGKSIEQIFNGPSLENGFIDEDELGSGEKRKELHTSDLIRIIMTHPEVKDVRNLFISNVLSPEMNDKKEWALVVDDSKALIIEPFNSSRIRLFKNESMCPVDPTTVTNLVLDLEERSKLQMFDDPALDLVEPLGNASNLTNYQPLANKLPSVYGIGETGLPSTASAKRRAQAKQLKAYLLFFEQILVNYLRQLDSFKRQFAFRQNHVFEPIRVEFIQRINAVLTSYRGLQQSVPEDAFTSIQGVNSGLSQWIRSNLQTQGFLDNNRKVLKVLSDNTQGLITAIIEAAVIDIIGASTQITPQLFTGIPGINQLLANEIWNQLHTKSYIDNLGKLSPEFNPEETGCTLELYLAIEAGIIELIRESNLISPYLFTEIPGIDRALSLRIWSDLKAHGYLDEVGALLPAFSPDAAGFTLSLSPTVKAALLNVMPGVEQTAPEAALINIIQDEEQVWVSPYLFARSSDLQQALSHEIWIQLEGKGFIDQLGKLLPAFTPDTSGFTLGLNLGLKMAVLQAIRNRIRITPFLFTGISGINQALSNEIWIQLKNKKFIDYEGKVLLSFAPERAGFKLDLYSTRDPKTYFSQLPPGEMWREDFPEIISVYQYNEDTKENGPNAVNRKNRILNHLLAQFNEKFADVAWFGFQNSDYLNSKANFLKNYPELSRNRNRAGNLLTSIPHSSILEYTDGLKNLIAAKLGMDLPGSEPAPNSEYHNFFIVDHILLRPEGSLLLNFICSEKIIEAFQPDPYSYRLTFVFAKRIGRFTDSKFRELIRTTIENETPAHISYNILEMDPQVMKVFTETYQDFLIEVKEAREGHLLRNNPYRNTLIELLGIGRVKLPVLHFDAHNIQGNNTKPESETYVTGWTDLSHNNHDALWESVVGKEALKPIYVKTGNLPLIRLSGGVRFKVSHLPVQDDFSIIVVYRATAGSQDQYFTMLTGADSTKHNYLLAFKKDGGVAGCMSWTTDNIIPAVRPKNGEYPLNGGSAEKSASVVIPLADTINETSAFKVESSFVGEVGNGVKVIVSNASDHNDSHFDLEVVVGKDNIRYENISMSRRDVKGNGEKYVGNEDFSQITIKDIHTKFNEKLSLESTTGLPHIAIFTREKASGEIKLSLDGVLQTSQKLSNSNLSLPQSSLYIGSAGGAGIFEVGEVIILDSALSGNRKQKLEEYLSVKWQIPLSAVSSISKPVLQLDASNPRSVIRDEKTRQISRWTDVSPAGMDVTSKAGKVSPEYRMEGIGGLPVVYFENPKLIPWSELMILNRETVLKFFTKNTEAFLIPVIEAAIVGVMRGRPTISKETFTAMSFINSSYSGRIWEAFHNRGYIDDDGNVSPDFKPEKAGFPLGLGPAILNPVQADLEQRISTILSTGFDSNTLILVNAFMSIGGIDQSLSQAIWSGLKTEKYIDDTGKVLKVFTKNTKAFIVPIIEGVIMNEMRKGDPIAPGSFTGIPGVSSTLANEIVKNLKTKGYINDTGHLTLAFTPEKAEFELGLDAVILQPVQAEFEREISAILSNFSDLRQPVIEDTFTMISGVNLALSQAIRTGLIEQGFINHTGAPKLFARDSFTIAIVYQTDEWSLWGEGRLLDGTATQADPGKTSWSIGVNAHHQFIVRGGNQTVTLNASPREAHMAIVCGKMLGNELSIAIYFDGKSAVEGSFMDAQVFRNCPTDLAIGRSRTGANPFTGQIGEIIILDQTLTVRNRQRLENYLSQKWAVDISGVDRVDLPIMHLDASRLATVTMDNSAKVTRWVDLSYYSNHATQDSFDRRPKFTEGEGGINGLGSILFTQEQADTADYYEDSLTIKQIIQNDFTMMVVFKPDTVYYSAQIPPQTSAVQKETGWTDGVALIDADCSGIYNDFGLSFELIFNNDKKVYDKMVVMGGIGDRLTGDHTIKTKPMIMGEPHFITFTRCQATGEVKLYADGMLHAEADLRDNVILNDSRSIKIGAFNSEGSPFHGQMGEVIIFNKILTDKQRQSIEKYISVKWRIPYITLPINIAALGLHLDAANFDSVQKEPDYTVSGWVSADTMESITASQATGPNRPLYVEDCVNGMPGIRFNNSFMTVIPDTNGYDDLTIACVFNPLSTGNIYPDPTWNYGAGLLDNYAGSGARSFGLAINRNKEFMARINTESIGTPVALNSPHIAVLTRKKDTGEVKLYVDGLSISPSQPSQEFTSNTSLNDASHELTLGAIRILTDKEVSKGYYHGDLAEVVLFNRVLPVADRQMLEKHLSMKWRIDISGLNHLVKPVLHLDASLLGTIKIENGKVSQWLDVNGHNVNAVQTKEARRPTYLPNPEAYHGLGVVHFDSGQRQYLTLKPVVKDDFTVIIVYRAEKQDDDSAYKPVSKDSFTALTGNNDKQAEAVVSFLETNGFINPTTWKPTAIFDPDQADFTLGLDSDTAEIIKVRDPIQGKIENQIGAILSDCADAGIPVRTDSFAEIGGLDKVLSETIWSELLGRGYINEQGLVLKRFTQNTVSFIIPMIESAIINTITEILETPVSPTLFTGISGIDGAFSSGIWRRLETQKWIDGNGHVTSDFTPDVKGFTLGLPEEMLSVIRAEFATKIGGILSRCRTSRTPVPNDAFTGIQGIQGVDLALSETIKTRLNELRYIDVLGYYLNDFTDVPVTFFNSIIELAIIHAILATNRVARRSFIGIYGINETLSGAIWAKLFEKQYINSDGTVLPKFNPGQAGFRLDLGILEPAQAKIENYISSSLSYCADEEISVPADAFSSKPSIPDIPGMPGFNQDLSRTIWDALSLLGYIKAQDPAKGKVLKAFTKNTEAFIIPVIETAIINVILAEHWISGVGLFDGNCPGVREDMYKRDFGILIDKSGALSAGIGVPGEKDSEVEVPASFNAVHIGVLTRKKDTGLVRLYVDNTASDPVRIARNVILKDSERFTIGAVNTGGNYFKGDIAEIIVLDRVLEAKEITAVQRYLAKKWDVPGIGE
ncbi:MAG TPA: LamG-like jellyroll fold domain-containing protein [Bacillota bacterium]|nr:LamG-like jellyroll fold domain-containing protein [Bacillota bacterium]